MRGRVYASLSKWDKASADFAKMTELKTTMQSAWNAHALLCLHLGDMAGYRRACARQLESYAASRAAAEGYWVAWICALAPEAGVDIARVIRLAEKALAENPTSHFHVRAHGAALLRAGKFEDAEKQLKKAAQAGLPDAWLLLSITYQRWGKKDEAKTWLDKADRWLEETKTKKLADPAAKGQTRWELLSWEERLALQIFRREAEALLKTPPAPKKLKES
jgi:tetratricopeptide (TPR) repeat protein